MQRRVDNTGDAIVVLTIVLVIMASIITSLAIGWVFLRILEEILRWR